MTRRSAFRVDSRRLAHVEPDAAISSAVATRPTITSNPKGSNARAAAATMPSASVGTPSSPSPIEGARSSSSAPVRATRAATPAATTGCKPTQPRSSEPQGKRTVARSAPPASARGGASAAARMKRTFSRPPLRAGAAARRDASAIAGALASMPRTRVAGSREAASRTARPSPVPISIVTRWWRATSSATYPTSSSKSRRPTTMRIMRGRISDAASGPSRAARSLTAARRPRTGLRTACTRSRRFESRRRRCRPGRRC